MNKNTTSNRGLSRRSFISSAATAAASFAFMPSSFAFTSEQTKPNSKFNGVQVGAITYSWRSMPSSAQDIIKYCVEAGINSIELMGNVAEEFAGIPPLPPRPPRGSSTSEQDREIFQKAYDEAWEKQREWRL
ncbi:MAG: hypothetical protein WDA19_04295, partial [Mariniphaga sp.]